jgi:hypothetical protein
LANFSSVIITPKAFANSSPLTPKALANNAFGVISPQTRKSLLESSQYRNALASGRT